jgi:hypothetical protein
MDRRAFIRTTAAFIAAPAIVRASSLMPVKAWSEMPPSIWTDGDVAALFTRALAESMRQTKLIIEANVINQHWKGTYDHR